MTGQQLSPRQMERIAVEVNAKLIWGYSAQEAIEFACSKGVTREAAETMAEEASRNREREVRKDSRRGLVLNVGMVVLSAFAAVMIAVLRIPVYGRFMLIYAALLFAIALGLYRAARHLTALISGRKEGPLSSQREETGLFSDG